MVDVVREVISKLSGQFEPIVRLELDAANDR